MEYYKKMVCVTFDDLTSGEDAIMKKGTLDKMLWRHPKYRVREGRSYKYALIDYYALPQRYRQRFEERFGDPKELIRKEVERVALVFDEKARKYFMDYEYDKGSEKKVSLPDELIEEYTINASVLNILAERYDDRRAYRKALGGSTLGIWETISELSESLRESYGHTLPGNTARLREKVNRYKKEGYESLISVKIGNRNTTIITEEAGRMIIALKRSRVPVYTDRQIFEEYNRRAPEKGFKPLKSLLALRQYLNRPEIAPLWEDAVYGELKAFQRRNRKHQTELPTKRDTLWYGDGTKLNLYYKAMEGGRTVVRTMQVYEVVDAYSEVFLGYHISETEDYEAQYNAYRMAVQTAGHRPYELVHDNQGGHKKKESQEFFDNIARVRRSTKPDNGQSKTIESIFGRFQSQILHKDWRFTGQNITAKKESSRQNIEFVNANVDKLYTLEELKAAYADYRKEWNEAKHPATGQSRMEMYLNSENPEAPKVTEREMVDMFWLYTDRPCTYTDNGLRVTIKGVEYRYEVYDDDGQPDRAFLRANMGRKFIVRYDPSDSKAVELYTVDADGRKRFARVAKPYFRVHRAILDQVEGERAFIAGQLKAEQEERIEHQAEVRAIEFEHGVAPEQHGLRRPKLAGINRPQEEVEREIERRMKKYRRAPLPLSPGQIGKEISLAMINPLTGKVEIDERRVAGKL